jgi:DNA-binding LytR/AlgR family response regulator
MSLTKREMHPSLQPARLAVQLTTVLALAVALAVLGPFGTYTDLSVPVRYAYWVGLVLAGYLGILLSAHALAALRPGLGRRWALAVVTLVSAIPTSLAVAWVESLTRLARPVPLSVFPRVYACVALIQLALVLFLTRLQPSLSALLLMRGEPEAPAVQLAAPETPAPPAFFKRIPSHLGSELLALEAEDHYLRVITAAGSDLILMRMSDALAELGHGIGLQVHRSWWVAHAAIAAVNRNNGRTALLLKNGLEVPVSRTYLSAVRAALAEDGA